MSDALPTPDPERCRMLELVVRSTSSMVVVTDGERRIRWVNPAYTAVTGWTLDEVRGRNPASFLHGPDTSPEARARLRELLRSGRRVKGLEIVNYKKSGEPYWVSLNIEAVLDERGAVAEYVAVQEDITERRRAAALSHEKALLEQAARVQMEALSRVSHELRTPLHAVIGFAEMIERQEAAQWSERSRQHLQQIRQAADHLVVMVNDILELARLREGGMPFDLSAVRPAPLVRQVLAMLQPLAARAGVTLESRVADAAPRVHADRKRLVQVLLNLVANAVQYNRPGGRVWVREEREDDGMVLSVHDDGPGIDAQDLPRLFQPFYRAPSAAGTAARPGSGLGLPIARNLVEGMGGVLLARSTPGQGSCFSVHLPLAVPEATPPGAVAAAETAVPPVTSPGTLASPTTVLYIEDDEFSRDLVRAYLGARPSVSLVCCVNVRDGIAAARHLRPPLILCDMNLPDGSGLDVLRAVQDDAALVRTTCVALSAAGDPAAADEAIRAGFRDFLPKPIDAETFLRALDRLLEAASARMW